MRLSRVEARNVFSIEHVELELSNIGLTLISGENGSGKSSIASKSIVWGLYGVTPNGVMADDVVRRQAAKSDYSFVEIEFEGVDGKNYRVYRSRQPKAFLALFAEDNTNLSRRQQSETQELINKLLGRDVLSFLQTDYMGQGREQSFLSLTPKQQKGILEDILPISYLSKWAEAAKKYRSSQKAVLTTITERLNKAAGRVEQAEIYNKQMNDKANEWDTNKRRELPKLLEDIGTHKDRMKPLQDLIETKTAELREVESSIEVGEEEKVKCIIEEGKKNLDRNSSSLREAKTSSEEWGKRKAFLEGKLNSSEQPDVCPVCGQKMSTEVIEKHIVEQRAIQGEINKAEESLAQLKSYIDNIEKQINKDSLYIKAYEEQLGVIYGKQNTCRALQREISDTISRTQNSELPKLQEKYRTLLNSRNPFTDAVRSSATEVQELKSELEKIIKRQTKISSSVATIDFWVNAFSKDFRFFMLEKACPFLENRVSQHLKELNSSHLHARFSTTKQLKSGEAKSEFDVSVWSDEGGEGFGSLSGGEQQLLSFSVGLALADLAETQVGGASSVMILDEPFIYLDAKNSESLVNYLIRSKRETTLLISNDEHLKSLIPNVIGVTKDEFGRSSLSI